MFHRLAADKGGHAVKARGLQQLHGLGDALGHILRAVGVGAEGDEPSAALLEAAQQGQPDGKVLALVGVELQGVVGGGDPGENIPDLVLIVIQRKGLPVPADVAQGIDEVG